MSSRVRMVAAYVTRVMGPDLFEANIELGFDVSTVRRLKLAGVDSSFLRNLSPEDTQKTTEFLRSRIEDTGVFLRPVRKGEHYYAHVYYGREESNIVDEMVTLGLLKRFDRDADR
jgi:hypothetical protein